MGYAVAIGAVQHQRRAGLEKQRGGQPEKDGSAGRPAEAVSSAAECIIENATNELTPDVNLASSNEQNRGRSGIEPNLRKYRFTAVLTFPDSTAFGAVTYRSQSEIRWMIQ